MQPITLVVQMNVSAKSLNRISILILFIFSKEFFRKITFSQTLPTKTIGMKYNHYLNKKPHFLGGVW
jgi:hypothetical protein